MNPSTRLIAATGAMLLLALAVTHGEVATYRLTIDNTWSETTHPGNLPESAHFSWLGGGTHTSAVSFWNEGVLATPGITEMAESGRTTLLAAEVGDAIAAGNADAVSSWKHWFCPAGETYLSCGALVVEFDIDDAFPLVTLVTMLGPSPDWFVGVSGLPLHDGDDWVDGRVVDLRPYDGGTRSDNVFALGGTLTTPPVPVSLITSASGQLIGPGSLGTFTFQRLGVAPPPPVPALGSNATALLYGALLSVAVILLRNQPSGFSASGNTDRER